MTRSTLSAGVALAVLGVGPDPGRPAAAQGPGVEYVVLTDEAPAQIVKVSMIVRGAREAAGPDGALDVLLPVWRPGRYQVLDMAGTFRSVSARTGDGTALPCEKLDKSAWRIAAGGAEEVIVDAVIYANSLGDRTRHADDTHVFLSPSAAFPYVPALRSRPCRVRIDAPPAWRVATGLPAADQGANPRTFHAESYDVLVDSPLEIGLHEVLRFEVEGSAGERAVPHEIVIWTGRPETVLAPLAGREHWDPDRLTADFAKVVRAQREVFGDLPYDRYVYIVHCYPGGGGGTEHLNSTVMQCAPSRFDSAEAYRGFLGLMSHEMFHTWNVKRLRPAGIKPYDYQRENYTRLLWVSEGTTSYYDDLVLARTGLMKPDDYLKILSGAIDAAQRRPGMGVQTLEDSSFDAWIKFNRPTPDAANATVSFYDKGALASLVLDMAVRESSGGDASLDDVMRDLYRAFPLDGPGFTTDDVLAAVNRRAGRDLTGLFVRAVRTTEPLDFASALRVVGLEVALDGARNSARPAPRADEDGSDDAGSAPAERASLGLSVTDAGGLAIVSAVASDGPAYAAGIIAGDTILAVNGARLRAGELASFEKRLAPGDLVKVTLFRYDALREVMVTAAARPDATWTVRRVKDPTDAQRTAYESWLKQPWPGGAKPGGGGSPEEETP